MEKNNLYNWLEKIFKKDNHKKYHKYFDEWFNNLTNDQLYYFDIQRLHIINNWLDC